MTTVTAMERSDPELESFRRRLPDADVFVFLASYNRANYLAGCLENVLKQTYRSFHVVVVDDASPDSAADVARHYANVHPDHISAICKPSRRGVAHSVNLGLSVLRDAPFVAFHADDDLWHPRKLEKQIQAFAANPLLGFVATDAAYVNEDGQLTGELFSQACGIPDLREPAKRIFTSFNNFCGSSIVARREALELVGHHYPIDGICNDMYNWLVISAYMPIEWIPEPLTLYRQTASSLTLTRSVALEQETIALRNLAYRSFPAVRAAVGGTAGKKALDDQLVFRAVKQLRAGRMRVYLWYVRHAVRNCSPRMLLVLAYYSLRAIPSLLRRTLVRSQSDGAPSTAG